MKKDLYLSSNIWLNKYDLDITDEEVELIISLILGKWIKGYPQWIFEIVANSNFQLDVDKCDYLVRDSYYIGFSSPLQIDRIYNFARIIDDHICFHKRVYFSNFRCFHGSLQIS